jgi:hypothetical protein
MDYDTTTEATESKATGKAKWPEIHKEALEDFRLCQDAEDHNRKEALDDLKFSRLSQQWHPEDEEARKLERRPCMTINKMPAFIRQVVNDGRQNKPAIKVHPADDKADPKTADVINGLIRNIEYTSKADVAYDTGLDFAASCGIGYWGVDMEYSHDDSFEMDLVIRRKPNPFAIYGDYAATCADSSEWNLAFEVDKIECAVFEKKYKKAEKVDWDSDAYENMPEAWREGKSIMVASYWRRREIEKTICLLSDGRVVRDEWLTEEVPDMPGITNQAVLDAERVTVVNTRMTTTYEVTQYIMNGVEILEEKKWAGRYIPIVPVYGEELNVEGKRYFRSLIRDAKDAQRNFNYWRTTCTELVALAPKAPFVGPTGSFDTDADKWATANTKSHPFIEYDPVEGQLPPQRQPFAGVPAGALQEALNASDDMKAVIGIYDASLGARSNETSGRAINARKVESDTGTFHFIDNQARAIRHTGVILIDLIPHVYNKARIIRVMGVDKKPQNIPVNQPLQGQAGQGEDGDAQIYDLTVGKYDLTVDTGPGFQTKREEAAYGMTELMRAFPPSAAVIGPHLAKAQDWPGAEEIGDELAALAPGANGQNPAVMQAQQQIGQLTEQLQQVQQQFQGLQQDRQLEAQKLQVDMFNAQTNRMKAQGDMNQPEPGLPAETLSEAAKIQLEGKIKAELLAIQIEGNKQLEILKQQGAPQDPAAQQQAANYSAMLEQLMGQMAGLHKMIAAPRVRTLVRDPASGRATHALDEIHLPEEEAPAEPMPGEPA